MYQGWGYMQKANNMVSKQFARHLDFNTKKNGEFEAPHFFLMLLVSYILNLQVCLSVCPGSFRALPGPAWTFGFVFFWMGFVFCDSYYSTGALCTRFTLVLKRATHLHAFFDSISLC